jgi:hypothetical protein
MSFPLGVLRKEACFSVVGRKMQSIVLSFWDVYFDLVLL